MDDIEEIKVPGGFRRNHLCHAEGESETVRESAPVQAPLRILRRQNPPLTKSFVEFLENYGAFANDALEAVRESRPDSVIVLSFRMIQSERIDTLSKDITDLVQQRRELSKETSGAGPEVLRSFAAEETRLNEYLDLKLHIYARAIRDYETLSQEALPDALPKRTLFLRARAAMFSRQMDAKIQAERVRREKLLREIPDEDRKYMFRELNREIRLEREKESAYFERLWMGTFGGVALIGPMLLMVLHQDRNTSVITTSVATLLFAIVLSRAARELEGKDVLAATAAYAAVLVVFVGASLAPVS